MPKQRRSRRYRSTPPPGVSHWLNTTTVGGRQSLEVQRELMRRFELMCNVHDATDPQQADHLDTIRRINAASLRRRNGLG